MSRAVSLQSARRGFSLAEVLASTIIFGVAIVAFIQGMGGSLAIQADLTAEHRAATLAQNVMEEIVATGDLRLGSADGAFDGENAGYAWATEIRQTDIEGLVQVEVQIAWNDGHGPRRRQLATLVAVPPTGP